MSGNYETKEGWKWKIGKVLGGRWGDNVDVVKDVRLEEGDKKGYRNIYDCSTL